MRCWFCIAFFAGGVFCGCEPGSDVVLGDIPLLRDASHTDGEGSAGEASSESDVSSTDAVSIDAGMDGAPPGECLSGERVPAAMRALLSEAIGYGRRASGGANGCLYHVTSLADRGPGTLREAAERLEPLWIVFDVSGDIELASNVVLTSNKTVDGRGKAITLRSYGLTMGALTSNVVVENVNFVGAMQGSNNDALQIVDGAHTVWIDHCSFSNYGDGLVDITRGATDVTVSWSLFSMHDFAMLIGRSVDDTGDVVIRVTVHHNWWNQIGNYAPRLRYGRAHVFNNLIDRWRTAASACSMGGQINSENNVFVAGNDKVALATSAGTDREPGRAKSLGDWLQNGAIVQSNEPDLVFDPAADYAYSTVRADASLQDAIMASAGAR